MLVAAMIRVSTFFVSTPPRRMNSRSWITRNSFAWVSTGTLPISSKKIVPLSASSKSPFLAATAPVNAPLRWPNRFDSSRSGGRLPEFTVTKGWSARGEPACRARAASSLPVPLSPSTRIVVRLIAACVISSNTWRMRGLRPMMFRRPSFWVRRLARRVRFSVTSRRFSAAFRTTTSTSSFLKGLVM